MSEQDYLTADNECFSIVNTRHAANLPQVAVIVPLSEVNALNEKARKIDAAEIRIHQLKRIGAAGLRAGAGLIFIGGMVRGLVDPGFAVVAALACVGWAIATYRRSAHG